MTGPRTDREERLTISRRTFPKGFVYVPSGSFDADGRPGGRVRRDLQPGSPWSILLWPGLSAQGGM